MDNNKRNIKLDSFKETWDEEYIEIDFNDIKGEFYPNERGLVEIRGFLKSSENVDEILLDGDFAVIENFDDDFYAFAHLKWDGESWLLNHFNYDPRCSETS